MTSDPNKTLQAGINLCRRMGEARYKRLHPVKGAASLQDVLNDAHKLQLHRRFDDVNVDKFEQTCDHVGYFNINGVCQRCGVNK